VRTVSWEESPLELSAGNCGDQRFSWALVEHAGYVTTGQNTRARGAVVVARMAVGDLVFGSVTT
jgi:hypothetical protein